jgi:arginine/lysine/ornithine decarboxylase
MLHISKNFPQRGRLVDALNLLQTTSPSYLLMASLDLARRQIVLQGEKWLNYTLRLAEITRSRLAQIAGLEVLTAEDLPQGWTLDGTKLVIGVRALGLTGYQAMALLVERYHIHLEMADPLNVVAFLSPATTAEECETLIKAFQDIAQRDSRPVENNQILDFLTMPEPVRRLNPRAAWLASEESVPVAKAIGRISAETVAVYPPGIPVLCPGEEITSLVLEYLRTVREHDLPCHGPADARLKNIRVVVE